MERVIIFLRYILLPILPMLSLVYYISYLISKRFTLKRQTKFSNVKVVCVGNPTLGGSGKTVIVEKLVQDLKQRNKKVAVIIRGYKRKLKKEKVIVLSPQQQLPNSYVYNVGDEAFMLFHRCRVPIGVSSDRVCSIKSLLKFSPEIIVSDDGYQNFKFYKDINILVINLYDFKNKDLCLLPFGRLREPLTYAIVRAEYFILNHVRFVSYDVFINVVNMIKKLKKDAKIMSTYYKIQSFISLFNSRKQFKCNEFLSFYPNISLACGIAKPDIFVKTLEGEGFTVMHRFIYSDHYWYKTKDVKKWCRTSRYPIVVSYKDAVRLFPLLEELESLYIDRLYYCDIKLEFEQGEKLWEEMLATL